jgi:trigger factor
MELRESRISLKDYLRNRRKTEEELKEELRPIATKRVTQSLVLAKVVEAEGIEVTDEEIDGEVEALAQGAGEQGEELRKFFNSPAARRSLEERLLSIKTVKRLVELASGETEST